MAMNHEIRFDISKDIIERLDVLIEKTQRRKSDLSRSLFLMALEQFELKLSQNYVPVYIPIPNSPVLKIKFEENDGEKSK